MTDLIHPDRHAKLAKLREAGIDPYPARGVFGAPIEELVAGGGTVEEPGPLIGQKVTASGRMLSLRDFGKLIFAPLQDRTGRIQIGLQKGRMGDWWPLRKNFENGDLVGLTGELGRTQKGELTIWVEEITMLSKTLAQPPEKWHGLVDREARYRRRYVDLWASEDVRDVFIKRSQILSFIRRLLEARGFLEVETPTLHPVMGGAAALPFVTHHNALDMDLFLRIAPELYLKRLIVGGLERVFEFSRNFRNEGLSTRHNPEFTMLELYQAQADFTHMMEITEAIVEGAALAVNGTTELEFRGQRLNVKAPFEKRRYDELFREVNGFELDDEDQVRAKAAELNIVVPAERGYWKLAAAVWEETVEERLSGPIFVTHYPVAISPLAKADPADPRYAERFEIFVAGMELANAFSELNDPEVQAQRFEEQVEGKDPEDPGEVDVDYVQALEYGMPPAGGLGIGIDRLVMVLLGQDSIRDVLLFPTLRRKDGGQTEPDAAEAEEPAAE